MTDKEMVGAQRAAINLLWSKHGQTYEEIAAMELPDIAHDGLRLRHSIVQDLVLVALAELRIRKAEAALAAAIKDKADAN